MASFPTLLRKPWVFAWIENMVAECIGFAMFLSNEITLCIFGMVSFQTLLIKPKDSYTYKEGRSKTIGFAMFL